jgi:hypothetical protein
MFPQQQSGAWRLLSLRHFGWLARAAPQQNHMVHELRTFDGVKVLEFVQRTRVYAARVTASRNLGHY